MSFAATLKTERERLGLTQAGAAAVLEVSKSEETAEGEALKAETADLATVFC